MTGTPNSGMIDIVLEAVHARVVAEAEDEAGADGDDDDDDDDEVSQAEHMEGGV